MRNHPSCSKEYENVKSIRQRQQRQSDRETTHTFRLENPIVDHPAQASQKGGVKVFQCNSFIQDIKTHLIIFSDYLLFVFTCIMDPITY